MVTRKAFKDLGKLSLIYLLGKVFQVAGKVLLIIFKPGKAFKKSRKGFFLKIPWERNVKGMDSVLSALLNRFILIYGPFGQNGHRHHSLNFFLDLPERN